MTLESQATSLAAGRGQAAALAVLVGGVADPVDASIVSNILVHGVHKDDLVVFEGGILVHPVGVQHAHVAVSATNTLLSDRAEVASEFKLTNTGIVGLSVHNALGAGRAANSATTTDGNADHIETLLGFVAELVGLIGSGGTSDLGDSLALTVLPCSNTEQVAHHIGLLLAPDLFQILVSTHC